MINKKLLFIKINVFLLSICILFLIIFSLLGIIKRTGYLSNFNFDIENINRTLELNGLNIEETKSLFSVDNVLDNTALTNYIFTNDSITNYSYNFRLLYYSKVFRNSDLYNVYIDIDKAINNNGSIKEIKINEKGTPFGILISDKKLDYNEKIDNISYTLLLKFKFIKSFILFIFAVFLIIWIVYFIVNKIELNMLKLFFIEKKKYIFITYISLIIIFILFFVINSSIRRKSNLTDLQLIAESKAGYVYKAKVEKSYKDSPFYINNNSIRLNNTNNIKYYGYSLEITNKPEGSWYDNNDTFYTDNSTFIVNNEYKTNGYFYNIQVPTYIGDKYKITIFANQLGSNRNMFWYLNEPNDYKEITKKEVSNDQIILSDIRNIFYNAYGNLNFYLMFPQGLTEVKSILIESLNTSINSEDGYTIFTTESKIDNGQTLEINYKLKNKFSLNVLILLLLTLPTLFYMYCLLGKLKSDIVFPVFVFMIGIILFAFQFWLCFPGYYNYPDAFTIMTEAINNVYTNWHPFIIGLTLHFLYKIFGYHTFYIFFINLFLWYVGLSLIIISLYYKFKNRLVILLFSLSFLANIFFANITHLKDITATLFFFFSVSILMFQMLVNVKNKFLNILINILMYISLIFALLWRHNFIVTIYPIFIVIVYRHLKNINNKKVLLLKFCSIMLIIAFVLIAVVKISPVFFSTNEKLVYMPSFIILYHIASCAVPADDGSLIPNEWYLENRTFEDLKYIYNKNGMSADLLVIGENKVFRGISYKEKRKLQEVLINYILKYPLNYIKHIINYSIEFITNTYIYIPVDQNSIQGYDYGRTDTYKKVFGDQRGIVFDTMRYNIYSFLYVNKIYLTIFYFVILSIALFFITGFIWIFKSNLRDDFLLLSFSLAFSAVATIVILCLFTPIPLYRYIYPVVVISLLSFISFIIYKLNIYNFGEHYEL